MIVYVVISKWFGYAEDGGDEFAGVFLSELSAQLFCAAENEKFSEESRKNWNSNGLRKWTYQKIEAQP